MSENRVKRAIDTDLSGLRTTARQREQIVQYAMEGQNPMSYRSKFRVSIVLAIALVMMTAVTALAVGLTNYFSGFAELENEYGEYEQWPGSAKVQLVELMLESGALTAEDTPQWTDDLTGEAKEAAAAEILDNYFAGMVYVDFYNIMLHELGPIEQWTDEQRAMMTEIQQKHGLWTQTWPVYEVPGAGDLNRDQAVAHARKVLLDVFDVDQDYLDSLPVQDAVFSAGYNQFGLPEDEPFWTIQLGYGFFAHMTRNGEMLQISANTVDIPWGVDIMTSSRFVEPSEYDATREEVTQSSRDALTELGRFCLTDAELEAMIPAAQFFWNEYYQFGEEPVWLVTWSLEGEPKYQVLLTYDAKLLDVVHYGKLFRNTVRDDPRLDNIVADMMGTTALGLTNLRFASFEEQAVFCQQFKSVADEYVVEHPYFFNSDTTAVMLSWQYTRNALGVPDDRAISPDQALQLGLNALGERLGHPVNLSDWPDVYKVGTFYITTNPERPQYRFIHIGFSIAVDAYTGDVFVAQENTNWGYNDSFIGEIIE